MLEVSAALVERKAINFCCNLFTVVIAATHAMPSSSIKAVTYPCNGSRTRAVVLSLRYTGQQTFNRQSTITFLKPQSSECSTIAHARSPNTTTLAAHSHLRTRANQGLAGEEVYAFQLNCELRPLRSPRYSPHLLVAALAVARLAVAGLALLNAKLNHQGSYPA